MYLPVATFYHWLEVLLDIWWALEEVHVGSKLCEDIKFKSNEFGISWLPVIIHRLLNNKLSADQWGFWRLFPWKWIKLHHALTVQKKILWYSGSHSAEEVYSAWVPSLSAAGGSCWSLHILLAALLTQNTVMTSPLSLPSHTVKSSMFPCGP